MRRILCPVALALLLLLNGCQPTTPSETLITTSGSNEVQDTASSLPDPITGTVDTICTTTTGSNRSESLATSDTTATHPDKTNPSTFTTTILTNTSESPQSTTKKPISTVTASSSLAEQTNNNTASATTSTEDTIQRTTQSITTNSTRKSTTHTTTTIRSSKTKTSSFITSNTISSSTTDSTTSITTTTTTTTQSPFVTFKATIRNAKNRLPISDVTVTVYVDEQDEVAGAAVTDTSGVVRISIKRASSYRVVLDNLPEGYSAKSEYLFSTPTVNIGVTPLASTDDHSNAMYTVGSELLDFTLTDTDGNVYTLSELKKTNKLIILDFWYVDCTPCKEEFPFFQQAIDLYSEDVTLLAINPFDKQPAIENLRRQFDNINFPMMIDTCHLSQGFSAVSFPTTVFVDSDGHVLDIHVGAYSSVNTLIKDIEKYLD